MNMSFEDRQKLSELYKIYSNGSTIEPTRWNSSGAEALAQGIIKMLDCSKGMSSIGLLTKSIPKNFRQIPGWKWLITTAYRVLTAEIDPEKSGQINATCYDLGADVLRRDVQMALLSHQLK